MKKMSKHFLLSFSLSLTHTFFSLPLLIAHLLLFLCFAFHLRSDISWWRNYYRLPNEIVYKLWIISKSLINYMPYILYIFVIIYLSLIWPKRWAERLLHLNGFNKQIEPISFIDFSFYFKCMALFFYFDEWDLFLLCSSSVHYFKLLNIIAHLQKEWLKATTTDKTQRKRSFILFHFK